MMGPDPVVTTSPTPDAPAAYLPQAAASVLGQEQRPVRQRADPVERGPVGEPPTNLSSLLGPPSRRGAGEQQAQQHQHQHRMILATQHDTRQVNPSPRGRDQQLQQPQQYAKSGVPAFAGSNNFGGGFGNDANPLGSVAQYGGGGRAGAGGSGLEVAAAAGGANDSRLHSRNNLLLHLQPLPGRGGSRLASRGPPPPAAASSNGQPQRHHHHQQHQRRQLQAAPPEQQRWRHQPPPAHLQQQPQPEQQHRERRDRDRALNPTPPRTNFVHQTGATPPAKQKTPGEIWLCNSEGRFIAPAGGAAAAAAADAAAREGVPAGSGSPIITALQAKASPEKVLPAPMAVKMGTPKINPKCPECQDLVRARLDEPALLREDRHCDEDVFGGDPLERAGEEGGNAVSPWRLRNKTRTGHVGLILCLNIGGCRRCC